MTYRTPTVPTETAARRGATTRGLPRCRQPASSSRTPAASSSNWLASRRPPTRACPPQQRVRLQWHLPSRVRRQRHCATCMALRAAQASAQPYGRALQQPTVPRAAGPQPRVCLGAAPLPRRSARAARLQLSRARPRPPTVACRAEAARVRPHGARGGAAPRACAGFAPAYVPCAGTWQCQSRARGRRAARPCPHRTASRSPPVGPPEKRLAGEEASGDTP